MKSLMSLFHLNSGVCINTVYLLKNLQVNTNSIMACYLVIGHYGLWSISAPDVCLDSSRVALCDSLDSCDSWFKIICIYLMLNLGVF